MIAKLQWSLCTCYACNAQILKFVIHKKEEQVHTRYALTSGL
jgi:hypothetical protein